MAPRSCLRDPTHCQSSLSHCAHQLTAVTVACLCEPRSTHANCIWCTCSSTTVGLSALLLV